MASSQSIVARGSINCRRIRADQVTIITNTPNMTLVEWQACYVVIDAPLDALANSVVTLVIGGCGVVIRAKSSVWKKWWVYALTSRAVACPRAMTLIDGLACDAGAIVPQAVWWIDGIW